MTTKTLLSLATVSLLAFAAKADTSYIVETTNSWFSVDAASDSLTTNWSGATPTREEEAEVIDVDTDADNPAFYTPTVSLPSASRYRVKGNMTVTLNADVPADTVFGNTSPKAALVAVAGSPNNKWYGWNGSAWVALTGISAPEEGASYDVAIEFFVESSQLKIKYIVENVENKSAIVTAIESGSTPSTLPTLTKVGLAGYGSFGDFGALGFESFEVTIDANKVEDVKTAMGITEITSAELNKKGANGLTKWQSLVLGIDPRTTTKPYTAPVQTDNGNLGFTIGAAEIGKYVKSGADVTVEVYESSAADEGFTRVDEQRQTVGDSGNNYTATVEPDSSTGVKYYKIKISIANP